MLHVWVALMILSPSAQIPSCLKHDLRVCAYNSHKHTYRVAMGTLVSERDNSIENLSLPLKPVHKWNDTAGEILPPSGLFAKSWQEL